MKLVQILLPLYSKKGNIFPDSSFEKIRIALTEKFGGITAYTRSPASGLWKESENKIVRDDIVVFEIMVDNFEKEFWKEYKLFLEDLFDQDEIIIRVSDIEVL